MSDYRLWTEHEDKILKFIRDDQGIQKWSTIAQKMAQQFGIKGRNGKQCKQRYMEVFDDNGSVLHWDYETEQSMFTLHDKIGNKWAAIGLQLNNRTDNDVKNHFYSKIRKGLRKINYAIKGHFKKELKEVKQTVLCKIIQGAQDRFSSNPIYQPDIWEYCKQAKNILLRMGYDEIEYNPWNDVQTYRNEIREFIETLNCFGKDFQRKPKLLKKQEGQQQVSKLSNFQTQHCLPIPKNQQRNLNTGCDSQVDSSQPQESQSNQMNLISQQTQRNFQNEKNSYNWQNKMEIPQLSRKVQKLNSVIILKSSRDLNEMLDQKQKSEISKNKSQKDPRNSKSSQFLLPCIPKLIHISSKNNAMIDEQDEDVQPSVINHSNPDEDIELELMRQGLLEQEQKNSQHFMRLSSNGSKKIASKGSNFSSYSIDEEDGLFFGEDSTLNMRIFTTGVGGKKGNAMEASMQKSGKLFESLERSAKLFQSVNSRGDDLQMSIQRSTELKNSNSFIQSEMR